MSAARGNACQNRNEWSGALAALGEIGCAIALLAGIAYGTFLAFRWVVVQVGGLLRGGATGTGCGLRLSLCGIVLSAALSAVEASALPAAASLLHTAGAALGLDALFQAWAQRKSSHS